jgi:hypothetical protein
MPKANDKVFNGKSRHPMTQENLQVNITNVDTAHHFLQYQGYFHSEFIPHSQTVNPAYYVEIMKQLHEAVYSKRPELWPNDWILHHDNVTAHKALSVKQCLAQEPITEMEHPTYYPDLVLNDF